MLDHPALAAAKFFQLKDGKHMRYALFEPERTRGTILIAPGRREFIEKKYAEMGTELLQRGFRLIFFEWRGQGLSDRFLPGSWRQRDHILTFDTHLDDLSQFYEKVVKPCQTGPLIVSGHSLGGHLMLRWLIERQMIGTIAAALLTAPMLALASIPAHTIARTITWSAVRLGHGSDYAPAQHDYSAQERVFKNNPLTHDEERFSLMEKYFAAHPDLTVGGVTWGWLEAALQSLHHVHQRHYFDHLKLPALVLLGSKDHVTPTAEISRIIRRMPQAESIILDGALHDILNEADGFRLRAWQQIDIFLEKIMPH